MPSSSRASAAVTSTPLHAEVTLDGAPAKVFFSPMPSELEGHIHDVSVLDKVAVGLLAGIMIAIGVFPSLIVPLVQSGVQNIMHLLGA